LNDFWQIFLASFEVYLGRYTLSFAQKSAEKPSQNSPKAFIWIGSCSSSFRQGLATEKEKNAKIGYLWQG